MFVAFEVLTVFLAACAFGLSLAHALELPGKLRLGEADYRTVQTIYYPGFVIGGGAEPASVVATVILLLLTPLGSAPFWLTLAALLALLLMQLIFWVMTQPVNRHWLKETELTGSARHFFGTGRGLPGAPDPGWTALRDQWERSHVLRALCAGLALVLLTTAVALSA